MTTLPLFGFAGRAGSGKDTAARIAMVYLAEHGRHRSTAIALADPLKSICSDIFNTAYSVNGIAFHGNTADKNAPLDNIPNWTGRKILQHIGTEGFRHIAPDIWVHYALNKAHRLLHEGNKAIFITDVRFKNEAELIQAAGGLIVRIKRDSVDDGMNEGIENHASENEISLIPCDYVIDNAGTLNDLNQKVRNLLCQHLSFLHST